MLARGRCIFCSGGDITSLNLRSVITKMLAWPTFEGFLKSWPNIVMVLTLLKSLCDTPESGVSQSGSRHFRLQTVTSRLLGPIHYRGGCCCRRALAGPAGAQP